MRTNVDWEAWGKVDPLYGVAALPGRAKADPGAWTSDEFLELGARDWTMFRPQWEQYGRSSASCLEIGCGAGRITAHLARDFQVVHAVDVSADMIRLAERHVAAADVTFHVTDGIKLPLADRSVASVFSTHVFQHFGSTSDALACLREIGRVMEPSGTLMIHLPIIVWPHGSFIHVYRLVERLRGRIADGVVEAKRWAYARRLRKRPIMQVTSYDLDWLSETLTQSGFRDIEIRVLFGHSDMGAKHPFLFARKNP